MSNAAPPPSLPSIWLVYTYLLCILNWPFSTQIHNWASYWPAELHPSSLPFTPGHMTQEEDGEGDGEGVGDAGKAVRKTGAEQLRHNDHRDITYTHMQMYSTHVRTHVCVILHS